MKTMLEQIRVLCDEQGIARTALVIDDDYHEPFLPPQAAWTAFVDGLSEIPSAYAALNTYLAQRSQNLDEAITRVEVAQAFESASIEIPPGSALHELFGVYASARGPLEILKDVLEELQFTVKWSQKPMINSDGGEIPSLLIVDYHLNPEDREGANACRVFTAAMDGCRHRADALPPFVILMSRELLSTDQNAISRLAEKSGLFRFNYEFVQKEEFSKCPSIVSLTMLKLFRHAKLSKTYFRQLLLLENATKRIASETVNRLFQITPAEVTAYRTRVHHEGISIASALNELFSTHVSVAVHESTEVLQCMNDFDAAFTEEKLPIWDDGEGGQLHRLYAGLLFSSVEAGDTHPPRFGDVYCGPDQKWLLVISQECDLASGIGRVAKARTVLCLSGQVKLRAPEPSDGAMIARPFMNRGKPSWMWWDLLEPQTIPYKDLYPAPVLATTESQPVYKKCFRLRNHDAEDIQQQFAARLTRVGGDVFPSAMQVVQGSIEFMPSGAVTPFEIGLLKDGKNLFVAFLHPAQMLLAMNGLEEFIPTELLLELCALVKIKDFKSALNQANITCVSRDGTLTLGVGSPRHWQGLPEWKEPS